MARRGGSRGHRAHAGLCCEWWDCSWTVFLCQLPEVQCNDMCVAMQRTQSSTLQKGRRCCPCQRWTT